MSCRILLRCVGMAVLDKGLRGLLKETPFAGYLIDIATSAYDHFQRECRENREFQAIQSKVDKTLDAVSDGASKAFANIQKQSNPENKGSVELREIESAACATMDEIKVEAREVLAEIRRQAAPELRAKLDDPILQNNMLGYLEQIPGTVRASLKRPSDPSGKSLPKGFALSSADDFLKILPTQPPRFKAGDMPVGNWKLLDLLGVGGFGEVWKAEHPSLKGIPPVALKFCLSPDSARFLRHEGELLSRVMEVSANNPGIVKLRQAYIESDTPCLEYEFINGGDLCGLMSEWLNMPKERRTLLALQMLLKLARTIAPLHTMNPPIVHRDLKPANVLVVRTADGKINLKIGDFGIGGLATKQAIEGQSKGASQGEILTQTLRGSHTPLYAGPEQQRGDPPHPTDDVHALGVIGFQLLVCDLRRGPTGDWDEELRELGVSDPIIAMFKQCIARQARRYPHAGALSDELQNLIDSKPSTAAKPALPVPPVPAAIQANPFADPVTAPQSATSRSSVIDKTLPISENKSKKSQPRMQKRESNLNWAYRLAAIALIGVLVILGIAIYRNNTRNPDSEAEAMQLKLSKELNEKILQMNAQANARKIRDIPKETKQIPAEVINESKPNELTVKSEGQNKNLPQQYQSSKKSNSSKSENDYDNKKIASNSIIGKWQIDWDDTKTNKQGKSKYTFRDNGTLAKENKVVAEWILNDNKDYIDVLFLESARGKAKIELKNDTTLTGTHTWLNGETAAWKGSKSSDQQESQVITEALFNGKNLDGWNMTGVNYTKNTATNVWSVDPSREVLKASSGDFQDLKTNRKFRNFEIQLLWRFPPKSTISPNGSGIIVRSNGLDKKGHNPQGIELDFRPIESEKITNKNISTGSFIVYDTTLVNKHGFADGVINRHLGVLKDPISLAEGFWNTCRINCINDKIYVHLNGVLTNEAWGADITYGNIYLRSQNTSVEFQDIRIADFDKQ